MSPKTQSPPVVLIGGWGVSVDMVMPLVEDWPAPVFPVSLDDEGVGTCPDVSALAEQLTKRFPRPALWIGWSLGGQVAMAAAEAAPAQVRSVVTLCSFPKFVATQQWPQGMAAAQFHQFAEGLQRDAQRCRQRFLMLQTLGDPDEAEARRALKPWLARTEQFSPQMLAKTLDWLALTDQRSLWQRLDRPALHVWGDRDQVVNAAMADATLSKRARGERVADLNHWPRGDAMARCRQLVRGFVNACEGVA
ncbi:alpha/beta fold hydrolase [Marinobacter sp. SS21]|uniref:alpha/beta fold hydrolase n=1 Tax=Marinobacter sp. SS21 TaxID=2979460 RepID=UPI00232AB88B|nr:alpha/beta fold hydrolase [Marinobacter sp. SS21]MDC0661706.1 alpha/beta fold hydrolase [Marinobacter sp. SS21]